MPARVSDVLQIVMFPPGAYTLLGSHRPQIITRVSMPWKTSLNWFMPALVNSSVGSLEGSREPERTTR